MHTRNDPTGHQDDAVIAVMGVTGAGKSSFIKLLTGDPSIKIGGSLDSETSDVQILHFSDPVSGRKVTFVDTPGFDDSRPEFSDTDILKKIADFLLQEYKQKRKLSGLIFIQRISDPRFSGQSDRNLRMFRELCGPEAYKNVVVLTTYWDQLPPATPGVGDQREAQLKEQFFVKLVQGGAQFMRHDHSDKESARKVLRRILPMPPITTKIQTEMGEEHKDLIDTAAGSVHNEELEKALAKHKKDIEDLKAEMTTRNEINNAEKQELEKELANLRKSLERREREHSELKKGLGEEKYLRNQLETEVGKLRAQLKNSNNLKKQPFGRRIMGFIQRL